LQKKPCQTAQEGKEGGEKKSQRRFDRKGLSQGKPGVFARMKGGEGQNKRREKKRKILAITFFPTE